LALQTSLNVPASATSSPSTLSADKIRTQSVVEAAPPTETTSAPELAADLAKMVYTTTEAATVYIKQEAIGLIDRTVQNLQDITK